MNYALPHVFPAVLDVYSFLRNAFQPPALEVMDGAVCYPLSYNSFRMFVK